MPGIERRYTLLRFEGVAERGIPLLAWSGSVLASVLKPVLGERLVRVSPLMYMDARGGWVWRPAYGGGLPPALVEAGSRVGFEALLAGADAAVLQSIAEALEGLGVSVSSATPYRFSPRVPAADGGCAAFRLVFHPTIFVFRGRRVLHPSPARLLASGLKAASELLGVNLRGEAEAAAFASEVLYSKIRIVEVDIGGGRRVKAFTGTALLAAEPRVAGTVAVALEAARVAGVGKSRGIGFGSIEYSPATC